MTEGVFYTVATGLIVFFGVLILLSEYKHHREVVDRQNLISGNLTMVRNDVIKCQQSLDEYRAKYIEHAKSYNDVHDHLAKVTDQMMLLRKGYRVLKQGMVKRYEISVPNDFKAHMKTIAKKMEQFA